MGRRYVGLREAHPATPGTSSGAWSAELPGGSPGARPWGILGGTFDPIHCGHLAVAEQTRQTLDLAGVLFIPAARSPMKSGRPVSPGLLRIAMVELAIADNEAFRVSRMEIDRPAPSYTVDTLETLHAQGAIAGRGRPDPLLILSAETLPGLLEWRDPGRLLDLCRIAVVPRRGYPSLDAAWIADRFAERHDRFVLLDGPDLGHSASDIRDRVARGRSIRYLVPDPVARLIAERGRYGPTNAEDGSTGTTAPDEGR